MTITFSKFSAEPGNVSADAFDESERYYLSSLVEIISNRESSLAFAPVYRSLAGLYESQSRFRTAHILRREIIRIHEIEYGQHHPIVALDTCELAISCRKNGDTFLANQFYKRGLRLLYGTVKRLHTLKGEQGELWIPESLQDLLGNDESATPFGEQSAFIRSGHADECMLYLIPLFAHLFSTFELSDRPLPFSREEYEQIMSGVRRVTQLTQDLQESTRNPYQREIA